MTSSKKPEEEILAGLKISFTTLVGKGTIYTSRNESTLCTEFVQSTP